MPSQHASHWGLEPGVRFLNHGSFGACPTAVLEAQSRYRAELEGQPVRFMAREIGERLDVSRGALARFVHADAQDLVFVQNATTGVNSVLRSMELAPGDELLVTNQGYNACSNAARYVAERAGAKVVVVDLPFPIKDSGEATERVLAAVTPRTRLALLDHITSPTALVLPLAEIVPVLRERGVESLIDGAHAPGMLDLDLNALGAAYYTGNCHKWMCTPKGSALLWVRRELQGSVRPAVISHGANTPQPGRSRYLTEFDWCGTGDPTAVLCVPDAIRFFEELLPGGWAALRKHNHDLALAGRALLCDALGIEAPAPDDMIGSIASVPLPPGASAGPMGAFDVEPLQSRLEREHRIEVPIHPWPAPPARLLRISAQLYNAREDYQVLADALSVACAP
ncbi:MAG: aminotransferase class V-fold PLP-dependent enzyme [Planctomycetota bacterium]|nr:aminotransferase class V-fold PLP-dependent enzyme [Planctomycetota bacterium]